MRFLFSLTILAAVTSAYAQTPIDQARQLPVGTSVTVSGIITNGAEFGSIRYVQDGTGGLALFPGSGSVGGFSPARGSAVTVTGIVKNYFGLLELDPISSFTVNSTNNLLPAPQVISVPQMNEAVEGELVRVNGCTFPNGGGFFGSGTTSFASSGQSGDLFLRTGHPLIGTIIPSGAVDIVAIVSQYTTNTPANDGYQLLPRTAVDLFASTTIVIEGPINQTEIQSTSFLLNWTTNIPGTTQVRFGTSLSMGSNASGIANATEHSVALFSLVPATVYYTQSYSIAGTDTAFAPIGIYSTASTNPGSVAAYFTHYVDNSVATISPAISLGNLIDDTVRAYIDRAQQTLEYAVYNTTTTGITTSLNNAYDRGVQVRVIAEASNSNSGLNNLNAAIPILLRQDLQGSGMHNKFMVIDADDPNNAFTLTGSTNYTNGSFYTDANNLVIIEDQAWRVAMDGVDECGWIRGTTDPRTANSVRTRPTHATLINVGAHVESSFSPRMALRPALMRTASTDVTGSSRCCLYDELARKRMTTVEALPEGPCAASGNG